MNKNIVAQETPFVKKVLSSDHPDCLFAVTELTTLQMNITRRCNLSCKHCHVKGSPNRSEEMSLETLESCLAVFEHNSFKTLDITGGAPELHPHYQWLITQAAEAAGSKQRTGEIITRTNLVILNDLKHSHLPKLWAKNKITVACSLPHYDAKATNRQRGEGVFEGAIAGIKALNAVGYGVDSELKLSVVCNPGGAFLPPTQASAERDFRSRLQERYGISFTNLLTITNAPGGRFLEFLRDKGQYDAYIGRLSDAFNPGTLEGMMCRSQISVAWNGTVYDCDFNQAIDTPITNADGEQLTIAKLAADGIAPVRGRGIRFGDHCFACTAGAGSSCGGATT